MSAVGPGDLLLSLLRRWRLSNREQAVVITVLLASGPITALEVARKTRRAYTHTKAVIRTLVNWGILRRTPEGLVFQPDPNGWGPPTVPSPRHEAGAMVEVNATDVAAAGASE